MGEEPSTKHRRTIGICRIVVVALAVLSLILLVALIVVTVKLHEQFADPIDETCPERSKQINTDPPEVIPPFYDLTREEITEVQEFLFSLPDLNLKRPPNIRTNSSYIFNMELEIPNKDVTLNFLDKGKAQPRREAKVIIFRGDRPEAYVAEYIVGPLPNPVYKKDLKSYPFRYRPFNAPEFIAISILTEMVHSKIPHVLLESYGGGLKDCEDQCLKFQTVSALSASFTGEPRTRKIWFWLSYAVEFKSVQHLDFFVLMDLTSAKPEEFKVEKVVYAGETFDSLDRLGEAYKFGGLVKTRITFPKVDENLFSSPHRRGNLFPEEPLLPPEQFEPSGHRYSIQGRHVSYLGWDLDVRLSAMFGPQLFDIRYNNRRIVYELSLQEISVMYSANNPAHRTLDVADSIAMIGLSSRALYPGVDCPKYSTMLSTTFMHELIPEPYDVQTAFCVFEHNTGVPLRRHLSSLQGAPQFYEGMVDTVLIIRSIATIANYDYIIDFIFHQNGAAEVKVSPTGYLLASFRHAQEDEYGFRLRDHLTGNIHHHMFHFKVDMDINGKENRFETLDIVPVEVDNSKWSNVPNARYAQTKLVRKQVQTEKEAALKYNFDEPKYLTFYNNDHKTEFGVPRAYRLLVKGMSKQVEEDPEEHMCTISGSECIRVEPPIFRKPAGRLPHLQNPMCPDAEIMSNSKYLIEQQKYCKERLYPVNKGQEASFSWARYQVAVTKYKESEKRSSSLYASWDGNDPTVNFQRFIDDNEVISDEDQVTWVTMGLHHIPHMEDLPMTPTVGLGLQFFLLPFNYFDEDPAMGSGDAVRVEPMDKNDLNKGIKINRYRKPENAQCLPRQTKYFGKTLDEIIQVFPTFLFDP